MSELSGTSVGSGRSHRTRSKVGRKNTSSRVETMNSLGSKSDPAIGSVGSVTSGTSRSGGGGRSDPEMDTEMAGREPNSVEIVVNEVSM